MDNDYKNFVARMGSFDDTIELDDEMKHYGILGMKWGKRKAAADEPVKERRMSNKELNARLKRLRLEAEFQRLTEATEPKSTSRLNNIVAGTVGAIAITATLTGNAKKIYENVNFAANVIKKASGKSK